MSSKILGFYINILAYPPPAPVQTPLSPEWSSVSPAMVEAEGLLTEFRAQVEMHGGLIHNYMVQLGELSPALFERGLEREQERTVVMFGDLWRPVLALEACAGCVDTRMEMKGRVTTLEHEKDHRER
nr:hypothetical protein [Tanacetum cinerariifolium]